MTADQYITIAILALTFALLIKSKIPTVAVFVGALTLTITFRLAPLNQSLKGFSNPGMLTVGALLMVAAGMYRTGAITLITEKLIGLPKSLLAAQAKILPPVAVGSAFLNNTPLMAMFIPVIRDIAKISRLPAPRLYIPLSFASILGGTCTLIGSSTNLVVAGMVIDFLAKGDPNAPPLRHIAMFDLAWIGVPAAVAGIVFMMLTSRFFLPGTQETDSAAEITRLFGAEFKVRPDAPIIGKNLEDMGYVNPLGFKLLALKRNGVDAAEIKPQTKLEAGDMLVFSAMILTGCMTFRNAGNSLEFKTLIIIASAIGLEAAVTGSGLSAKIADLLGIIGGDNPYTALTVVFIGCIFMDTMITNVASAVFMFPIAMVMAGNLGANGMPFAITVMVGASCSFISPMGYQTNLMVFGPGRYKFTDFVKIGIPMTVLVGIITIILAPMVWPF